MTDNQAKKLLRRILRSYTPGSVCHLLADLLQESAEQARRASDATAHRQCLLVEAALIVLGMGVDSALPR